MCHTYILLNSLFTHKSILLTVPEWDPLSFALLLPQLTWFVLKKNIISRLILEIPDENAGQCAVFLFFFNEWSSMKRLYGTLLWGWWEVTAGLYFNWKCWACRTLKPWNVGWKTFLYSRVSSLHTSLLRLSVQLSVDMLEVFNHLLVLFLNHVWPLNGIFSFFLVLLYELTWKSSSVPLLKNTALDKWWRLWHQFCPQMFLWGAISLNNGSKYPPFSKGKSEKKNCLC